MNREKIFIKVNKIISREAFGINKRLITSGGTVEIRTFKLS